jgi:DNA-binding GntR family transcriptional regulator
MSKVALRDAEVIATRLDEIQDKVRSMIADGTLQPGERVNEQALAAQLGVGRSSAREALRSLERSGLVRIIPNRGAEVRKVSLEAALDLYDLRAGIARTAGRLAAARLENEEETQLLTLMDQMEVSLKNRDGSTYHKLNKTFHDQLMAITKNPRLIDLNNAIEAELSLYLRKGVYTMAQMQQSHTEHCRLVDALRKGQVVETAELFESHILTGKQRMLDTVTRPPVSAA